MTLTLICRHCDRVLTADDEDTVAELGQEHAREHGHHKTIPDAKLRARIRRNNPTSTDTSPQYRE